jgi:hypothetical protein
VTPSARTLRGLDWLNFFLAGILTQTPAGALVDRLRSKRALITAGIVALAAGALPIALVPTFWSVMSAQALIGGTSSIFGPAICAVSLGIVGHRLFDRRRGRNLAFNSAGNVVAAVSMGLCGHFISNRSIFILRVGLRAPDDPNLTLLLIRPDEIDYERARDAHEGKKGRRQSGAAAVGRDAGQGSGPELDDVHVGVRGDHAACHHVAGFLVGAESGDMG